MATKAKSRLRLIGLPGIKRETVNAVRVRSRTAAMRELDEGNAITASGDEGALTIWQDDDGLYRCEFQRNMRTLNASKFKYDAAVDQWLKDWMPKLYEGRT